MITTLGLRAHWKQVTLLVPDMASASDFVCIQLKRNDGSR